MNVILSTSSKVNPHGKMARVRKCTQGLEKRLENYDGTFYPAKEQNQQLFIKNLNETIKMFGYKLSILVYR